MNQLGIAACKDDQVSRIQVMTVIFLYIANFLLPFRKSCSWQLEVVGYL